MVFGGVDSDVVRNRLLRFVAIALFRICPVSLGTGLAATNVLRESFADYNRDAPKVLITSKEERRIGASSLTPCFYLRVEHPTTEREAEIVGLRTPNSGREFHAGMAGRAKALYVTVSMP